MCSKIHRDIQRFCRLKELKINALYTMHMNHFWLNFFQPRFKNRDVTFTHISFRLINSAGVAESAAMFASATAEPDELTAFSFAKSAPSGSPE